MPNTSSTAASAKISGGRPGSPVNKGSYGPVQHGQRSAKKLSDFVSQLQAKQTLKGYYGNITERQFRQ